MWYNKKQKERSGHERGMVKLEVPYELKFRTTWDSEASEFSEILKKTSLVKDGTEAWVGDIELCDVHYFDFLDMKNLRPKEIKSLSRVTELAFGKCNTPSLMYMTL